MNTNSGSVFILAIFALIGILIIAGAVWAFITEKRLKRFFMGKRAKDLEDTIFALQENLDQLNKDKERIEEELKVMEAKLRKSLRGLQTIRFNPFPDQGGNQSFAIGMLNEEGDGLVLSSLYSRERMSVYAKPIKNGRSEYELTAEEKEALMKAKVQ